MGCIMLNAYNETSQYYFDYKMGRENMPPMPAKVFFMYAEQYFLEHDLVDAKGFVEVSTYLWEIKKCLEGNRRAWSRHVTGKLNRFVNESYNIQYHEDFNEIIYGLLECLEECPDEKRLCWIRSYLG